MTNWGKNQQTVAHREGWKRVGLKTCDKRYVQRIMFSPYCTRLSVKILLAMNQIGRIFGLGARQDTGY